ncbi:MAG: bifunctional UDP-N-acetylglucosamine diphosphorylase/glucosamine-1-phosphate N-acetyltransferase GlmU [Pseudomonadota bacterium]
MTSETIQTRPAAVVILAAGKGTRMRSAMPKVLHPIGQAPMLHHAMQSADTLSPARSVIVVGHGAEAVGKAAHTWNPDAAIAVQEQQLGTGHAVLSARAALNGFDGDLFVLFGDTPFIEPETLANMQAARADADIVALGFDAADPGRYGRFILGPDGRLDAIVEAKDATPEQLEIVTCNSGVMAGDSALMLDLLDQVGSDNAQGEYYLTDVIGLARQQGRTCRAVLCDEAETLGINDRVQLAEAESIFQTRARRDAMLGGATLTAPETVFFSLDTKVGQDVVIHPGVIFGPGVNIGDGCEIKAYTHLEDTILADDVKIGPFARSRGGTELASGVRIGNFVETKKAHIGAGTKAGHLTYLGDAVLGAGINIGAGTITCNYDGITKHQTVIQDGAFIGVQTAMIAPITIGEGAYVATGTVLTDDVPADALALARTKQQTKPDRARRLRQRLAAKSRKAIE